MGVILHDVTEMYGRCRNRQVVNWARNTSIVDTVRRIIESGRRMWGRCDEVGYLVHVDPQAIERHGAMKSLYLLVPEALACRVEEVGEVDWPRPHNSQVRDTVPFDEDISFHPSKVGSVSLVHANTCPTRRSSASRDENSEQDS